MAKDNDDILLDDDLDDRVQNGDWAVGDGSLDDCLINFKLNRGTLKGQPLLGPNLQLMINSPENTKTAMKQAINLSLEMDGKYPSTLDIKNGNIVFEL